LQCHGQVAPHPIRDVDVQAADAGYVVAEALLCQDFRYSVFGHPRFEAVPQAVGR